MELLKPWTWFRRCPSAVRGTPDLAPVWFDYAPLLQILEEEGWKLVLGKSSMPEQGGQTAPARRHHQKGTTQVFVVVYKMCFGVILSRRLIRKPKETLRYRYLVPRQNILEIVDRTGISCDRVLHANASFCRDWRLEPITARPDE